MMCTTKNLVRSLLSGLLLMGVTMAGVPQAGATATGFAEIEANLYLSLPESCDTNCVPGQTGDFARTFGRAFGSGVIEELESSGDSGPVEVSAISYVTS